MLSHDEAGEEEEQGLLGRKVRNQPERGTSRGVGFSAKKWEVPEELSL
jgi:hypothetical protein